MNPLTEAIRKHHSSLANTLKAHARGVGGNEPQPEREAFVRFLKGDLLAHAQGEERHLYRLVDELVRSFARPTATMTVDHEFINDYVAKIEQTTRELADAADGERSRLSLRLRELALQLDAILELHLAKEERIYLPLVEAHVDEARQRAVLEAIHGGREEEKNVIQGRPLDVREIAPRERHKLIFETFAALEPEEAFILINDHDPRPLYYQFAAEHAGEFTWDYLEQGPEVWRVRIGRSA